MKKDSKLIKEGTAFPSAVIELLLYVMVAIVM